MAERQLVLCAERDAIQATRSVDCWCLGTGGARRSTVSVDESLDQEHVSVYLETCVCPEGLAEEERRDSSLPAAKERAGELHQIAAWGRASIPRRLRECRLWTWPSAQQHLKIVHRIQAGGPSLFLHGPAGTGKSGLAVGYAWEALHKETVRSVRFVAVPDMLTELRATYAQYSQQPPSTMAPDAQKGTATEIQVLRQYSGTGLLMIDDLGAESVKDTGWLEDRLYQIIGTRHAQEAPTVITSNYTLDQLDDRLGERITWRIHELVGAENMISFTGLPNLRE